MSVFSECGTIVDAQSLGQWWLGWDRLPDHPVNVLAWGPTAGASMLLAWSGPCSSDDGFGIRMWGTEQALFTNLCIA